MTVLVVVLLCAFAALKPSPSVQSPPPNPVGSDLPLKSPAEYSATVLRNRRQCALTALRKEIEFSLSDSFEVKLCDAAHVTDEADSANGCLAALQNLDQKLANNSMIESVEHRYSIRVRKFYLTASTGLGSADANVLKKRLTEGQEYLSGLNGSRKGPIPRFELLAPKYSEQGAANRVSEMWFGMFSELAPDLKTRIDRLWKSGQADSLKTLLTQSADCAEIVEPK